MIIRVPVTRSDLKIYTNIAKNCLQFLAMPTSTTTECYGLENFLTRRAPAANWRAPGFLKLILCGRLYVCLRARVCVCVCVRPRGY